jgi:hypothetical protein
MDETTYQMGVNGDILNGFELGEDSAQICERSSNHSGSIMTEYVCDIVHSLETLGA